MTPAREGAHGGTVLLGEEAVAGGPSYDAALGLVLLRRGTGGAREVIRVFNPEPTAGFSRPGPAPARLRGGASPGP